MSTAAAVILALHRRFRTTDLRNTPESFFRIVESTQNKALFSFKSRFKRRACEAGPTHLSSLFVSKRTYMLRFSLLPLDYALLQHMLSLQRALCFRKYLFMLPVQSWPPSRVNLTPPRLPLRPLMLLLSLPLPSVLQARVVSISVRRGSSLKNGSFP